jgi:hypothetical protein
MTDRVTHNNLQSNPNAAYLFLEEGPEFNGKRLTLTLIKEDREDELIEWLRSKTYQEFKERIECVSYFRIDEVLPLVEPAERKEVGAHS